MKIDNVHLYFTYTYVQVYSSKYSGGWNFDHFRLM